MGIGEASYGTVAPGYLKDVIRDPVRLSSALGLFYAAIPVGTALAYISGGWLAEQLSWQMAFVVVGLPGLGLSLLVLKESEVPHRAAPPKNVLAGLQEIAARPILWFVIGGYLCNSFALNGIAAFVSDYGVSIGFTEASIGFWFGSILLGAGFVGTYSGGRMGAYFGAAFGECCACHADICRRDGDCICSGRLYSLWRLSALRILVILLYR